MTRRRPYPACPADSQPSSTPMRSTLGRNQRHRTSGGWRNGSGIARLPPYESWRSASSRPDWNESLRQNYLLNLKLFQFNPRTSWRVSSQSWPSFPPTLPEPATPSAPSGRGGMCGVHGPGGHACDPWASQPVFRTLKCFESAFSSFQL